MSISFIFFFNLNPTFHTFVHLLVMNQLRQEFCGGGGSDVIGDNLVLRKSLPGGPCLVHSPGAASREVVTALGSLENLLCSENDS